MSERTIPDYGPCSRTHIYDLDESVAASGYPMASDLSKLVASEEVGYWLKDNFIWRFIHHDESGNYPKFVLHGDGSATMQVLHKNGETTDVVIDEEDIPNIIGLDWSVDRYCKSNKAGTLHTHIMRCWGIIPDGFVVDHIDRNVLNNRKCNLRLASKSENGYNAKVRRNNTSGVLGVSWRSCRNKWIAYIMERGAQKRIGSYESFDDAVKARLVAERDICGEFAPQRSLFEQYGIESVSPQGGVRTWCRLGDAINAYKRIANLASTDKGSGHDQALTGIVVNFDLTFSIKAWVEAERYRFLYFVSSQSTMHRVEQLVENGKCFNEYVSLDSREATIAAYENLKYDEKPELRLKLLYSLPLGTMLTARMTTNYRALKTIYSQRKNHRLPEWREFCKWVETLPYADVLITANAKKEGESK